MSLNTQKKGQIGVNVVERIVISDWGSRWQSLDSHNDDGIDGLIFLESGGEATGQVIYVQIKAYSDVKCDRAGNFRIPLGNDNLAKKINRWRRVVGAAVVVYVNLNDYKSYWVDAKNQSEGKSEIFIPRINLFNKDAKKQISMLCGTIYRDLRLQEIHSEYTDFPHLVSKDHIAVASRKLYVSLGAAPCNMRDGKAKVYFTRYGWRHITRRGRPQLTRFQSFVLLGVVRKIIENMSYTDLLSFEAPNDDKKKLFSARFVVTFPFRQTSVVKIVLEEIEYGVRYDFYTIYEPRRRRGVTGVRRPHSQ